MILTSILLAAFVLLFASLALFPAVVTDASEQI